MGKPHPRVPRSRVDELYLNADPLPSVTRGSAVVTSVEGDTVTVQIGDESVSGVVYQGDSPSVGDPVEIETRADLLVIPATVSLVEGEDVHVVADELPTQRGETLNIGGVDASQWEFLYPDTGNWTVTQADAAMKVQSHPTAVVGKNHITSPNCEVLGNWATNSMFGGATPSTVTLDSTVFETGAHSIKVAWPAALNPGTSQTNVYINCNDDGAGYTEGQLLTVLLRVFVPAGSPDVRPDIAFFGGGGYVTTKDAWVWVPGQVTVPVGGRGNFFVGIMTQYPTPGGVAYIDRAIFYEGDVPATQDAMTAAYYDGNTTDTLTDTYAWTGTVNASTSTHTRGQTAAATQTRLYLPSTGTAAVSPTPNSVWEQTGSMARRPMSTTVANTALVYTTYVPSGTTLADHLAVQYVSDVLPAKTISGTFSIVVPMLQQGATMDAFLQVVVRVVSGDGATERGVLYAGQTASAGSTVSTASNYRIVVASANIPNCRTRILTATMTPVVAQAGDRLVVEIGARCPLPNGSSRTYTLVTGDPTASPDYTVTVDQAGDAGRGYVWFDSDLFSTGGGDPGTGTLWSRLPFDVSPTDTLDLDSTVALIAGVGTKTVQAVVAWAPESNPDVTIGAGTQVSTYGSVVSLSGAVDATITVPATITTTSHGTAVAARARIGLKFVGGTDLNANVVAVSAARTTSDWPTGTVWFDPGAEVGGMPTTATSAQTAAATAQPYTASFLRSPGFKKIVVTAPPDTGGVVWCIGWATLSASTNNTGFDLQFVSDAVVTGNFPYVRAYSAVATTGPSLFFTGTQYLAPGQTCEIWVQYRYTADPGATPISIRFPGIQCLFLPGAVVAGSSAADPMTRYYDGDEWVPDMLNPATIDVSQDSTTVPAAKTSTNTSLLATPSTVNVGDSVNLVSTTTPTAASGTVSFYRGPSSSGPWSLLGNGDLTNTSVNATKTWTPTIPGTYYFRAVYTGSGSYAGSTSAVAPSVSVQGALVTKTQTISQSYVQTYQSSGAQISDPGATHQGEGSGYGIKRSLIGFSLSSLPADRSIINVVLTVPKWDVWAGGTTGTLILGWHDKASKPTTWSVGVGVTGVQSIENVPENVSQRFTLSGSMVAAMNGAAWKGVAVGPAPSTSLLYSGYSTAAWKVEVTYTTRLEA